ncbi:iron-containing alcohol dehydrogenase [Runella sp. MFBS21]|uniref:iron-containing alcohol dehydrogenase n=1 Tax=Runella sp. MFBS21 TaxID=3034018 RepID=UPI0023F88479|nr:iron-containing alcohol dehydrogenase [Runella sp. MFBS21]MDF7819646.1 iron-containing alcohol dehydrogenase [Runella sp. MFBS21]
MNNFQYHNPVRIIFGKGQIAQLPKQIPASAKVMMTYGGGSIFKNGVYEQVKSALKEYDVIEFGGIEPNPTYETLMKAVEIARKEGVDFLLSVGGGSVLDGTKFVAAAIPFEGEEPWHILSQRAKIKKAIPLGAVLTLPATGSEMNYYAVISRSETQEKKGMGNPLVYPQFSILDPETTFSLPPRQIANGIADAFTHVMEQYMTYPVHAEMQDRMAEAVLLTLIQEGPKMMINPTDYDAAANVMWAATMALNGLLAAGVPTDWATHQIGHELTALHGIDHARTLAVVLPHLLEFKKDTKRQKLVRYAKNVWQLSGSEEELTEKAIQKTADFYASLGIPTKASAYEIGKDTVEKVVTRFVDRGMNFGEHADITPEAVGQILALSLA